MLSLDIGSAIKGVGGILDELNVNDEERSRAKAELLLIENNLTSKVMEYESTLAVARRDIIVAEAQSSSWIARNWRPILMLSITFLLVHKYFLFPYFSKWFQIPDLMFPPELFTLLTVGVGGYVVGRSGEKIAKSIRTTEAINTSQVGEERSERKDFKTRSRELRKLSKIARKNGWSEEELDKKMRLLMG